MPEGKRQVGERTLNGSGGRDSARVRQGSPPTGMGELKKRPGRSPQSTVNTRVGEGGWPDAITGEIRGGEAAEMEERWSFVRSKAQPRWVWHAIDHLTGVGLA